MTDFALETMARTPLHSLHLELGARLVPFAGYEMPLHYPPGIMTEHLHTRKACGLFDVSHMGQVRLIARSGNPLDAALALERLTPADIVSLQIGRQRYALFTNAQGGILDDFMVANVGNSLLLVVNAGCKLADLALLQDHLEGRCIVEYLENRALVALQGPGAEAALSALVPEVAAMRFMDVRTVVFEGGVLLVSRSGYSGEDGYEISIPARIAEKVVRRLLDEPGVMPVGLGARDTLRLEAGLCLYGADIDVETTPIEAGLDWSIQKSRRSEGVRAGGFPGSDVVLRQFDMGVDRRRVGFCVEGRAPIRAGAPLFAVADLGRPIGRITSGAFSPTLQTPVAMGYVETGHILSQTELVANLRGRYVPVAVTALPFVPPTYKR